jgi:hypothetical protein
MRNASRVTPSILMVASSGATSCDEAMLNLAFVV